MERRCCCGCCSVRTGTQIIAVLCILSSGYNIFQCGMSLVGVSSSNAIGDKGWLIVILIAIALLDLVELVLSGLLIHGANSNEASRCRPWLKFNIGVLGVSVLVAIGFSIFFMATVSISQGVIFLGVVALALLVQVYFLNVVYQYIKELDDGNGNGSGSIAGQIYYNDKDQHQQMTV